jgi:tripartite ATP-independent transporter DctM subunit
MLIFIALMGLLFGLMLIGLPVALSMGAASLVLLLSLRGIAGVPWDIMAQRILYGVNNFTLLAIPFFILAGRLCNEAKITDRIFEFARCLVGHFRGGLGHVNVVASMIFAGMSGSAVADAGGLGQMEIKAMRDDGYDADFSTAVTGASATIGPIIPPSIPIVIYGALADTSIAKLLIGGFLPGVTMGIAMMILISALAYRFGYKRKRRATFKELLKAFKRGILPLFTPMIIMGGILSGVFTPTEASAIAVVYAFILGLVYKTLSFSGLIKVLKETMMDTAIILLIVGASGLYSWIIARYQVTGALIDSMGSFITHPLLLLLFINLFLLAVGCFIDPTPALFILTPVLVPLVREFGIDTVHFGVIMVFNLMIGLITPPVGTVLYTLQRITATPFERIVRAIVPFYIPLLITLVFIVIYPPLTLFLPNLVLGR